MITQQNFLTNSNFQKSYKSKKSKRILKINNSDYVASYSVFVYDYLACMSTSTSDIKQQRKRTFVCTPSTGQHQAVSFTATSCPVAVLLQRNNCALRWFQRKAQARSDSVAAASGAYLQKA